MSVKRTAMRINWNVWGGGWADYRSKHWAGKTVCLAGAFRVEIPPKNLHLSSHIAEKSLGWSPAGGLVLISVGGKPFSICGFKEQLKMVWVMCYDRSPTWVIVGPHCRNLRNLILLFSLCTLLFDIDSPFHPFSPVILAQRNKVECFLWESFCGCTSFLG